MTDTPAQRTRDEVAALKREWIQDPCWDIETTEGFEAHQDELLAHRLNVEEEGRRWYQEQLSEWALARGLGDNLPLAEYLRGLERRIAALEAE